MRPFRAGNHPFSNVAVARAHLIEKAIGPVTAPPLLRIIGEVVQDVSECDFCGSGTWKVANIPPYIRMVGNELGESSRSESRCLNELPIDDFFAARGAAHHPNDEEPLPALWYKRESVQDKGVHRVTKSIQGKHSVAEVLSVAGCEKTGHVFQEKKSRPAVPHAFHDAYESPKGRGLRTLKAQSRSSKGEVITGKTSRSQRCGWNLVWAYLMNVTQLETGLSVLEMGFVHCLLSRIDIVGVDHRPTLRLQGQPDQPDPREELRKSPGREGGEREAGLHQLGEGFLREPW
jgi:hypothetical protein